LIHIKGWRFDIMPHGISSAMREQERAASSVLGRVMEQSHPKARSAPVWNGLRYPK